MTQVISFYKKCFSFEFLGDVKCRLKSLKELQVWTKFDKPKFGAAVSLLSMLDNIFNKGVPP